MAEPASREILTLLTSKGAFKLQEKVAYPNGATGSFYRYASVTLIVDDGIRFLNREYGITDLDGHHRYIDYLVHTKRGLVGVEENGVRYHHPQIIGERRYREQLVKQNSCQRAGIKLFRFSTEDLRFEGRFEGDIVSYFGKSSDEFIDEGIVVGRQVGLYEHQEGALEEMAARREQGVKCFLAVLPTSSGKSRIVEVDALSFAEKYEGI
ncbi:MAG: hypothetical protein IJ087_07395 [Eggerthellaceae bacterium]|nr:hypothetical protein [Eggerthellaceae bacterium]